VPGVFDNADIRIASLVLNHVNCMSVASGTSTMLLVDDFPSVVDTCEWEGKWFATAIAGSVGSPKCTNVMLTSAGRGYTSCDDLSRTKMLRDMQRHLFVLQRIDGAVSNDYSLAWQPIDQDLFTLHATVKCGEESEDVSKFADSLSDLCFEN
jgi:hypothetical protein